MPMLTSACPQRTRHGRPRGSTSTLDPPLFTSQQIPLVRGGSRRGDGCLSASPPSLLQYTACFIVRKRGHNTNKDAPQPWLPPFKQKQKQPSESAMLWIIIVKQD